MSGLDIVRAWKDAEYRSTLSDAELARLPANPAGLIELTDDELETAAGGDMTTLNDLCLKTRIGPACVKSIPVTNCNSQIVALCPTRSACPSGSIICTNPGGTVYYSR